MTEIDALIKRLKRETPRLHCGHGDSVTLVRCDRGDCKCDEDEREQAAAALERLRDQVNQMKDALIAAKFMIYSGDKPQKLDEALSWLENDKIAMSKIDTALAQGDK